MEKNTTSTTLNAFQQLYFPIIRSTTSAFTFFWHFFFFFVAFTLPKTHKKNNKKQGPQNRAKIYYECQVYFCSTSVNFTRFLCTKFGMNQMLNDMIFSSWNLFIFILIGYNVNGNTKFHNSFISFSSLKHSSVEYFFQKLIQF